MEGVRSLSQKKKVCLGYMYRKPMFRKIVSEELVSV